MSICLALVRDIADDALNTLAAGLDWRPVPTSRGSHQRAWRTPAGDTVTLVRDELLEAPRLTVRGPHAARTVRVVHDRIPSLDSAGAVDALNAAGTDGERARALYLIGATVPEEPAQSVITAVNEGLQHHNREVRLAAVATAVTAQWPQFEQPLRTVSSRDPDQRTRDTAAKALALLHPHPEVTL